MIHADLVTRTYENGRKQRRLLVYSRRKRHVAKVLFSLPLGPAHIDGGESGE